MPVTSATGAVVPALPAAMIWIDYVIAAWLALAALTGLLRGYLREGFALLIWLAALAVGLRYGQDFAPLLQPELPEAGLRFIASFMILFLTTLVLGGLIGLILRQLLTATPPSFSDRVLGMLLGGMRGAILLVMMVWLIGLTPLAGESWWQQSSWLVPFQVLAAWMKSLFPAEWASNFNFR